jgi:NlpC/P60 family putative phage cell wall peptidase
MELITRDQVVAVARSWINTPYRHQGRIKGEAVDCGGLIICVCKELGLTEFDFTNYARHPDGSLDDMCLEHMEFVPPAEAKAGDVVLFRYEKLNSHMAMMTGPDTIIHAFMARRKVVEHRIDAQWRASMNAAYHIPGVEM